MEFENARPAVILLVEDDPDDQRLTQRAFNSGRLRNRLFIVSDGQEALDFVYRRGLYGAAESAPRPDLILLDLNLPRIDGRQVLERLKSDSDLCAIPVVVLTTSSQEEDILRTYHLGANCFMTKPVEMQKFLDTIRQLESFWFDLVVLPRAIE